MQFSIRELNLSESLTFGISEQYVFTNEMKMEKIPHGEQPEENEEARCI